MIKKNPNYLHLVCVCEQHDVSVFKKVFDTFGWNVLGKGNEFSVVVAAVTGTARCGGDINIELKYTAAFVVANMEVEFFIENNTNWMYAP